MISRIRDNDFLKLAIEKDTHVCRQIERIITNTGTDP